MKALQLHYTSCRRGHSGSAGFQTRTLTPGIRPDEQREIERRGLYRPPRDAKPQPTADELARDFPRALRFYRLESGRCVLTRSSYSGRDYSGRWGNFFAHSLVVEDGQDLPNWPIDYYEWEGWREGLSEGEDTDEAPPSLPLVDFGEITAGNSFGLRDLQEFLAEEAGRPQLLAQMGRAVLLGLETSRAVVIRDTPAKGLYWVACVQKLFPPRHAQVLTYSTYQDDPRGCFAVNATTGETDFRFDETERQFRFFMFDLSTGCHSEVPAAERDYPGLAACWLAEEPARLAKFFEFMDLFDHRQLGPELIAAADLFELSQDRAGPLGGESLSRMISFAAHRATPEGQTVLLEVFGSAAETSGRLKEPGDYRDLILFLAKGAQRTGETSHRARAFSVWLSLVRDRVLAGGGGLEHAEATWDLLADRLGSHMEELAQRALVEPWARHALPNRDAVSPEDSLFAFRTIWRCLELVHRRPPWEQPELARQVATVIATTASSADASDLVLSATPPTREALAAVCRLLAETACRHSAEGERQEVELAVGRGLGRALSRVTPQTALAARQALDHRDSWSVLYGEWIEISTGAPDLLKVFEDYRRGVLERLSGYRQALGHEVYSSLLCRLPVAQSITVSVDWLRSGELERFPQDLAVRCLELANQAVSLDPGSRQGEDTARLVSEAAARRDLALRPDRPFLRDLGHQVRGRSFRLGEADSSKIRDALARVSAEEYGLFLANFLAPALHQAGSLGQHQQVLLATYREDCLRLFAEEYLGVLKVPRRVPWPEYLQAALKYWVCFRDQSQEDRRLVPLESTARKGLLRALRKLNPKQLQAVRRRLGNARLDDRALRRWRAFEEALERRRRSPWARAAAVLVRGLSRRSRCPQREEAS